MTAAQEGIFVEGSAQNHFLEYRVGDGARDGELRDALAAGLGQARAKGQHLVAAFGDSLWRRLAPGPVPSGLRPFDALGEPAGHYAPATQRDIWLWLQAPAQDANFDLALALHRALAPIAELELEIAGFKYRGERDLIGFVDGTGNPKDRAAQEAAALIPDGGGGAFLMTQQWVHDLPKFNDLGVEAQEKVVGRTKIEDVELEGEAMPADSHVSRTDVTEDGVAMKVYRRSSPYGGARQHGLYYVAFACDLYRFDIQLKRMYGLAGDGLSDRLIEFSRAVTGAYWYAPGTGDLSAVFGG
ncbi:MAG: Dyp-type peroxidase [Rhodospirillales bacterium]|nr:Dyp-type peroxidase [Rhodospirillales bacterium]